MLRRLIPIGAAGVGAVLSVCAAAAQDAPAPSAATETRTIAGRVLRGTESGDVPVPGLYVVLHRVSSRGAGPVDSVRTARDGSYRFRYEAQVGTDAMYIVSARHAGVAYFTAPIRDREVVGTAAEITVFDSSSTGPPLTVQGRHVVISPPAEGRRQLVDVFEIANETRLTRVSGDSPHGTWNVRLPAGVENPSVGQGEIPPDAVQFAGERAVLFAPVSPGVKQVIFTYELPASQPDVVLQLDQPVSLLELLVEGGGAVVAEGALVRAEPVSVAGREFDRFLGRGLSAGSVVRVALPGPAGTGRLRTLLLAVAGAVALALGMLAGRGTAQPSLAARDDPDALAQAIAALDVVRERQTDPEARAYHDQRREALKARLVAALAEIDERGGAR